MENVQTEVRLSCPLCGSSSVRSVHEKAFKGRTWSLARCDACGLHFTDPKPTEEFLDTCYEGDFHANLRAPGASERVFGSKYRRYADWLGRFLKTGRVLDLGCSTGLLVKMLCDRGYKAEGVEINKACADWARSHYGVTVHDQPLERCGLEPGSFDAVLMTDVLEHTLDPPAFLRSVGDLLRPGGLVLVTFPDVGSLESRYFKAVSRLVKRPWVWKNCHIPLHIWEFTRETAVACFQKAGFEVADFHRAHLVDTEGAMAAVKLLTLPTRLLGLPGVASRFGTQMEFLIRKTGPAAG